MLVGLGQWGRVLVDSINGKSDKFAFSVGLKTSATDEDRAYAAEKGFELITDPFAEAVKRDDIDAVVLCSPHSMHADHVAIAAAAGKHIACEKPFTLDAASARGAVKAARDAGVTLAVLHNRRFLPNYRELRRILASGKLGTICHIEANHSTGGGANRRTDPRAWRVDPTESPLGSLTNRGIHALDAMVGCCGPIAKVFALSHNRNDGPRNDTTACMLWFENGVTGYLGTLWATTPYWWLKIYGVDGTLEMRDYDELVLHMRGGEPEVISIPRSDMEHDELEAFADAVAGIAPWPMSDAEMISVPAFLEAAVESDRAGMPVDTK
jgi:predicted dehydrogenase